MSRKRTEAPPPGLHPGADGYEYWDACSFTRLKFFEKTAAHVRHYLTTGEDEAKGFTAADRGVATHHAILQPEVFEGLYVRGAEGDLRTGSLKTGIGPRAEQARIIAENPGKVVVPYAEWDDIFAMRDAVWAHRQARTLLEHATFAELPYTWKDPGTDLLCKAKIDLLTSDARGWPAVVDLKTIREATERRIKFEIHDRLYHVQARMYADGLSQIAPLGEGAERRSLLLFVEAKAPYCPRVVEVDAASMDLAKRKLFRWLGEYRRCMERRRWPGYSEDAIEVMGVPEWVYRDEERELEDEENAG